MTLVLRSLILSLMTLFLSGFSQTDTLNHYNAKGKKDGYWKAYFDKNLMPVKDSSDAMYYGVDYYYNGRNATRIFSYRKKDTLQIHTPVLMKEVEYPIVLDGEYVYYDKKHTSKFVEVYKNGSPQTWTVYDLNPKNIVSDCVLEFLDFTRKYQGEKGSFYYEYRWCNRDEGTAYWVGKIGKKWTSIKIASFKPSEIK